MNLQQFKYVLEVYRQRSISKAAESLYITQPTLSIALKELEKELGFAVFERSNRGAFPTAAGMEFIHAIQNVCMDLEAIQNRYSTASASKNLPVLRISTSRYTFVTKSIIRYYQSALHLFDTYHISLEEDHCQQVISDVLLRKSDFGIIHTNQYSQQSQLELFRNKNIQYTLLFHDITHLIFRREHPLHVKDQISKNDIIPYTQIRTSSRNVDYYTNQTNFSFSNFVNNGKNFFISDRATIYSLLSVTDTVYLGLTGQNVSDIYPQLCARPFIDGDTSYFYLISLKDTPLSSQAKQFIKILKQEVLTKTRPPSSQRSTSIKDELLQTD